MDVGQVQSTMIGMALFDMYSAGLDKMIKSQQAQQGDPLIAAAFAAFDQYANTMEAQHSAMIAGLSTYVLTPKNGAVMNTSQMAPLLALNVMA